MTDNNNNNDKCQFRLNAEEELQKGTMNFKECGEAATRNFIAHGPITLETIILDLCDEHFQYMMEQEVEAEK